jgi:hypothetical protein
MYEGPEPGGSERRAMVGEVNMKVRVWVLDVDVEAVVVNSVSELSRFRKMKIFIYFILYVA